MNYYTFLRNLRKFMIIYAHFYLYVLYLSLSHFFTLFDHLFVFIILS